MKFLAAQQAEAGNDQLLAALTLYGGTCLTLPYQYLFPTGALDAWHVASPTFLHPSTA